MTGLTRSFAPVGLAAAALALAGCTSAPVAEPQQETAAVTEPAKACEVLDSRDWAAWINRMPGPGAVPTVHVTGQVDVRTAGYTFAWQEGPLDRSAVPALRLKLVPKAPDGMAAQVITTQEVRYAGPARVSRYSRVIISCGGTTLAEITDIPDVH